MKEDVLHELFYHKSGKNPQLFYTFDDGIMFFNTNILKEIKFENNMGYVRMRRRGLEKVSCEIMLMCLGRNTRKLFTTIS